MNKSKVFCNIFLEKNIDFDENEIKIKRDCMNSQEFCKRGSGKGCCSCL